MAGGNAEMKSGQPVTPATAEVPITSLQKSYSPRIGGEDRAHIARLAESDEAMPPILVQRNTLRIIDGMHCVRAAEFKGREFIAVEYFDGSDEESFILAVKLNIAHGLPLSLADRKAAAKRILAGRPDLSDRAIAGTTGLSNKTERELPAPLLILLDAKNRTRQVIELTEGDGEPLLAGWAVLSYQQVLSVPPFANHPLAAWLLGRTGWSGGKNPPRGPNKLLSPFHPGRSG